MLLVVGSDNSSNSNRLVEVARNLGTGSHLIDSFRNIRPEWLEGVKTIALTAGASAPECLVEEVVKFLGTEGFANVQEVEVMPENVRFGLPPEIVEAIAERSQRGGCGVNKQIMEDTSSPFPLLHLLVPHHWCRLPCRRCVSEKLMI